MGQSGDITELFARIQSGAAVSLEEFVGTVYAELEKIARGFDFRKHGTFATHDAVQEVVLRLVPDDSGLPAQCTERGRFFCWVTKALKSILIDHYRRRQAEKRGGCLRRSSFDEMLDCVCETFRESHRVDVLALDEALEELKKLRPRHHQIVELRFFGGLSEVEVADALGLVRSTVQRDWNFARAWLSRRLGMDT